MTPLSTSLRLDSTILPMNGMAETVNGTIVAIVPYDFPTSILVNGMIRISRMMNGILLPILTMTSRILYSVLLGLMPS